MLTSGLYQSKNQCCGCELCSCVCPKNLIRMQPDDEGFLYPYIETDEGCIHCNKCINICPMKSSNRNDIVLKASFGGQTRDIDGTRYSSSGGYATAISKQFILEKGVVVGVRYSSDFSKSEYAIAETIEELEQFRTSKYIQAEKGGIYQTIRNIKRKKILFIGLPCEVSALYNYWGRNTDNLYSISLVCHGPTTPKVQNLFASKLKENNNSQIKYFSVRYKESGWKPYYIYADFENGKHHQELFKGSSYEIAFQYLKRPSCSSCRYKLGDQEFGLVSDLTLGDFHAVEKNMLQYSPWGVSQASVQSEKGEYLIDLARRLCNVEFIPEKYITKYNYAFHHPVAQKTGRESFKRILLREGLDCAAKSLLVQIPTCYINAKRRIILFLYNVKSYLISK